MRSRNFLSILVADMLVRTAYQVGKSPLLPVFAAGLGAGDALLGLIVSVSTFTGLALKPPIGILSDRWGRRWWLLAGTAVFAGAPFLYQYVQTPQQLFWLRVAHGLATAIYGPVTVAYVAEQLGGRRAEGLGWFGTARSAGYVIGPALGGWLLLSMSPADVFTVTGWLCLAAFLPVLLLEEPEVRLGKARPPLLRQAAAALRAGAQTPAIWLSGALEAVTYIATYAAKAFLPVYALAAGVPVLWVGLYFSVQEVVVAVAKPFGGRLGDRWGYRATLAGGMALVAVALPLLPLASRPAALLALAIVAGAGQALVFPCATALAARQIDPQHLGAGMGLVGTLENSGKVIGPVVGGALAAAVGYGPMFGLMGAGLAVGALALWLGRSRDFAPPHAPQSAPGVR